MPPLQLIGYWRADGDATSGYPHPSDWVDWSWDQEERSIVGAYFASGTVFRAYMGLSPCRICGRPNGAAEYTDGTYVWPEGLAHYIDDHGVRLPDALVGHAVARSDSLEEATVSEAWWSEQPKVRGDSVSSASSPDPELPRPTNSGTPSMQVEHSAGDDGSSDDYLDPASVWLAMAELLIADGGHRILKATARGVLTAGRAEVSWTEVHRMTDADYRALVSRAREASPTTRG